MLTTSKGSADAVRTIAQTLLVALPLVLPFEAPLFHLGPLLITSAELALYLVLGAWAVMVAIELAGSGARAAVASLLRGAMTIGKDPIMRAILLWLAIVAVSALTAPAHRVSAVKFALRTIGGAMLFFAARDLARSPGVARRVAMAIVAGAAVAAVGAVIERAFAGSAPLWQLFRPQAFTALGLSRASGAFAYPTMAAMYWEAALPLCALVLLGDGRGLDRVRLFVSVALATMLAALLVVAILLSATRSALVGGALASGALLILGWRRGRGIRSTAGAMLAIIALLVGLVLGLGSSRSLLALRLRWWHDGSWYGVHYSVGEPHLTILAGSEVSVPVTVQNTGTLVWPHAGKDAVNLSYHWETIGASGLRLFDLDGRRTPLPEDVRPGATVALTGTVYAPTRPARYRLRWDMVREGVTWFSERGNPTADQTADVVAGAGPVPERSVVSKPLAASLETWIAPPTPSRSELWRAALRLWRRHPLLGVGPDNFRHLYSEVLAPQPDGRRFNDERLHANSLYFETLADLGLLGMVPLVLLIVALLQAARTHAARGQLVALACALSTGTFFVHGVLDTFLAFTPLYGLFWLLVALTHPGVQPETTASPDSRP